MTAAEGTDLVAVEAASISVPPDVLMADIAADFELKIEENKIVLFYFFNKKVFPCGYGLPIFPDKT